MADDLRTKLEALRDAYDNAPAWQLPDDTEWLQDVWDLLDGEAS